MDTPHAEFDSPWKRALTRYLPDFMEFFLRLAPEELILAECLDQEFVQCTRDGQLGLRRLDKLVRLTRPDGCTCLWHIEVQASRQQDFAQRMFVCHYRLYDHFGEPVRSVAILGDPSPTWCPRHFAYTVGATRLTFDFEVIKLADYRERMPELLSSTNPFAKLVAAHLLTLATRGNPEKRMIEKWRLLEGLYHCGWERQKLQDVYDMIDRMMRLPRALQQMVDAQRALQEGGANMPYMMLVEKRAWREGKQEGRQEGRQEALRQVLQAQLAMRFGPLGEARQQQVAAATLEELERWCLAVVTARTIDEVF